MRPLTKTRSFVLALAAVCLHATSAFADETAAERLFREGRALMLDGRFDEACPMLEESQRLEPHVGTLLNAAACHERQGKVGSAWVEYQKALTAARAEGQAERAQLATDRIKAIEPRVPWLRISPAAEDLSVALDGGRLEHAAWGTEMPVDPGPHLVTAERHGAKVFDERVELREGDHRTVRIDVGAVPAASSPERAEQDRVVVEPKPAETLAAPQKHTNRWILEPGIFIGLASGTAKYPKVSSNPNNASITRTTNGMTENIACSSSSRCDLGELGDASGVAAGFNLFAGYALSDIVHLGTRLIVAPSLGSNGASVYGFGPSIAFHPTEAFTIGAWAFYGDATLHGKATVTAPTGYAVSGGPMVNAEGNLAGGFGFGVELSYRLFELGRGEVVASSTPFLIAGESGSAVCLPLGIAYRFQ